MLLMQRDEFEDRVRTMMKARKIFMPHITKNISIAFAMYQELFAEQTRDLWLSSIASGSRYPTFIDLHFERPHCPDCGKPLRFSQIRIPKGPGNRKGYKSRWFCIGEADGVACGYEKLSFDDITKAMNRLEKKPVFIPKKEVR